MSQNPRDSILPPSVAAAINVPRLPTWTPPKLEDIVESFTGQSEITDTLSATTARMNAGKAVESASQRLKISSKKVTLCLIKNTVAKYGVHPIIDALILSGTLTFIACLSVIVFGIASPTVLFVLLVLGFGVLGTFLARLFHTPGTDDRSARIEQAAALYSKALADEAAAKHVLSTRKAILSAATSFEQKMIEAHQEFERRSRRENEINELLSVDCRLLSGTQFEDFLAAVLRLHGYHVEQIGQAGDQGVDLIVSTNERRIAIQAKCYSGSVGNDSVQQVHAGERFHDCHGSMVITNSRFTPAAISLAAKVGCILIDGDTLPELIRGNVHLR